MHMNISDKAIIGKNVTIKEGAIIEDNVTIGDNCYIDYNVIIRENVCLGNNCFIGATSILGDFLGDFFEKKNNNKHPLVIGDNAIIRSNSIIYGDTEIGADFSSGHRITIREKTKIGKHVSIGTLSDIQGDCVIGDYVHMHSNVHIGMKSTIKDYVWLFPYVVLTNDPTPPSEVLLGVTVEKFAVVCTGTVVLPGVTIGEDALIGAGTNLTKNAPGASVVVGNPGKVIGDVTKIKDRENRKVYPWRFTFDRGMPWKGMGYETWQRTQENLASVKYD